MTKTPVLSAGTRTVAFLASQCITLFGSTLVQMAIVWYVALQTLSGAWVAAFSVCAYLPQFLISFVAGAWADRYSRKALIIGADASIAAVTLAMALLVPNISDDTALLGGLLAMSALRSLGAGIQMPAVGAVIPQIAPPDELMRYNGINATMQSTVQFLAPMAAGAVLMFASLNMVLYLDVATAVAGIGMLAAIAIPRPPHTEPAERKPLLADMREGVGYAAATPLLRKLLVAYGLFIFLVVPAGFLAQLYVGRTFGSTYWYLTAAEVVGFIGMLAGGVLMSAWGGFDDRGKTFRLSLAALGVFGAGMVLAGNFIVYLAIMGVYGVAVTTAQTATTTIIQEQSAPEMIGRMFGLMSTMYSGFLPLGMAVFGPLADVIPLPATMVASGVALVALAALARVRSPRPQNVSGS